MNIVSLLSSVAKGYCLQFLPRLIRAWEADSENMARLTDVEEAERFYNRLELTTNVGVRYFQYNWDTSVFPISKLSMEK
jgi:hypothetical protein